MHRLHVLGKLRRPVGRELARLGFDRALHETERNRRIRTVLRACAIRSIGAPEVGVLCRRRILANAASPSGKTVTSIGFPHFGIASRVGTKFSACVARIRRVVADFAACDTVKRTDASNAVVSVDRTIRESVADRPVERLHADEIISDQVRHDTTEHRDHDRRKVVIAV